MTDDELKRLFEALREDSVAIRQENAAAHSETRRRFDVALEKNAAAHTETRRHFDVALEATRHEIGLIAEKVTQLDEKLDRTAANLDEKIERTAAETQAMIKFSHAELDRRMRSLEESQRTLEESVSDLQARVGRLESSTH